MKHGYRYDTEASGPYHDPKVSFEKHGAKLTHILALV